MPSGQLTQCLPSTDYVVVSGVFLRSLSLSLKLQHLSRVDIYSLVLLLQCSVTSTGYSQGPTLLLNKTLKIVPGIRRWKIKSYIIFLNKASCVWNDSNLCQW